MDYSLRQHLSDRYEQVLLALAAQQYSGGQPPRLGDRRRALLHNPWQEQAVELGMRAALEMGDRVAR